MAKPAPLCGLSQQTHPSSRHCSHTIRPCTGPQWQAPWYQTAVCRPRNLSGASERIPPCAPGPLTLCHCGLLWKNNFLLYYWCCREQQSVSTVGFSLLKEYIMRNRIAPASLSMSLQNTLVRPSKQRMLERQGTCLNTWWGHPSQRDRYSIYLYDPSILPSWNNHLLDGWRQGRYGTY